MKRNNRFKAAIFDLDGLMLDTETVSYAGWKRAMADFGYELDDETYHKIIGLIVADVKRVFSDCYGSDFPHEKVNKRRLDYIYRHIDRHGIKIKPGLCEVLDLLDKAGLPKAVATSSNAESAQRKLSASGLLNRFDYLVCGDQVKKGKPAPDIFLTAAQHLKVAPADCLIFEDSENGLRAAHRAGMTAIMVPDVKQPENEVAVLAYKIFPSLTEVLPFLRRLLYSRK